MKIIMLSQHMAYFQTIEIKDLRVFQFFERLKTKDLRVAQSGNSSRHLHAVGLSGGGIEARNRRANSSLYSSSSAFTRCGSSDFTIIPAWWCFFIR